MGRAIASVLAGLVALTLFTFAIEAVTTPWLLRAFPDQLPTRASMHGSGPVKLFILAYSTLCMIAAGYLTAAIAGRDELRLAAIMAAIQIGLTAVAMVRFHQHAPAWAWLSGMALMLPAAWLGARVRLRRRDAPTRARPA